MLGWRSIVNGASRIAQRNGRLGAEGANGRRLDEPSEIADASCGMELLSWLEVETLDAVPPLEDGGKPVRDIFKTREVCNRGGEVCGDS